MQTYQCECGNRLFFENTLCLACGKETGWCPACRQLTALLPTDDGLWQCGHTDCGALLRKCHNYAVEQVCNRCVLVTEETDDLALCDYCRFNDTIPDLSIPGNRLKWYQLEQAKRRLLYILDEIGLPYGTAADGFRFPLSFDFKADVIPPAGIWRTMGTQDRVYTGHADGKITINLREADSVEREKLRVDLQEAHRTLVGHMRHEIGHYYWQMLIPGQRDAEFQDHFGNPETPPYAEALETYYAQGPCPNWQVSYISSYATMHPWEDFAETFAAYLDMMSVIDTAHHMGLGGPGLQGKFDAQIAYYRDLGVVLNEMNRSMGLIDLVPTIFTSAIIDKMRYVHHLVEEAIHSPALPTE